MFGAHNICAHKLEILQIQFSSVPLLWQRLLFADALMWYILEGKVKKEADK